MDPQSKAIVVRQVQLANLEKEGIDITKDAGSYEALKPEKLQALVVWADRYGMDVYAGHVLMMYGRPYTTEKGAIFSAKEHLGKDYQGHAETPITHAELKEMGFSDKDVGWKSSVYVRDYQVPISDIGVVTWAEQEIAIERQFKKIKKGLASGNVQWKEELKTKLRRMGGETEEHIYELAQMECAYLPIIRSPSLMAKARAIRRAHLSASPLGIPAGEPMGGIGTFESGDDGPTTPEDLPNFDDPVPPVSSAAPATPQPEPPAKSSIDPKDAREINLLCIDAGLNGKDATEILGTFGATDLTELSKEGMEGFKAELKKRAEARKKQTQAQMPLTR